MSETSYKIEISNERALRALGALNALDGHESGGKKEFNKFSAATRIRIAQLTNKMEDQVKTLRKARDAELNRLSDGKGSIDPKESPDKAVAMMKYEMELNEATVEMSGPLLSTTDLNLDENTCLSASVIAGLGPLCVAA